MPDDLVVGQAANSISTSFSCISTIVNVSDVVGVVIWICMVRCSVVARQTFYIYIRRFYIYSLTSNSDEMLGFYTTVIHVYAIVILVIFYRLVIYLCQLNKNSGVLK